MKSDKMFYMCDDVKKVRLLYDDIITKFEKYDSTFELINALSISHYRQYAIGHPTSIIELKNWHPA